MHLDMSTILEIASAIVTLGAAGHTIQRILKGIAKKRTAYRDAILSEAKDEAEEMKNKLESRIDALQIEFNNQKRSVSNDFDHVKETYNSEIKALGEKINILREDLASQHSSLVALLTRLVDKN